MNERGANAAANALGLMCGCSLRLEALLAPYPSETMTCPPVSVPVGNIKSNHPSLIEPIAVGVNLPKWALSAAAIRSHSSAGTEVARPQSKRPSLVRRGFNAC
jgi:hypothetical protein